MGREAATKPAVVLLSGGLDSATCLAIALQQGFMPTCLTVDYGQNHHVEVMAAKRIAKIFAVKQIVQSMPLQQVAHSSLTQHGEIPKDRNVANAKDIPSTYVPARNIIFLSLALALAESIGARDIFFGANHIDCSGYPDCRPGFIQAFVAMANCGTKTGVADHPWIVHTPLLELSKKEIVEKAYALGVDLSLTHSCYDPQKNGGPCGRCDSCQLRQQAFLAAGFEDSWKAI